MAAGDVVAFDQFLVDVQEGLHDLENDTIKVALIDSTQTPAATASDPRWGAGGTVNYSTDEVTAGGNYASGGETPSAPTVTLSGGAAVFDMGDVSIAQNGANPTDARWAIVYNDTDAGKRCIEYVDLGGVIDLSSGAFSITWNASGVHSLDQA